MIRRVQQRMKATCAQPVNYTLGNMVLKSGEQNKMSEKCTVENYIFVLPYGGKIIDCYYKEENREHLADRYLGRSPKDAKKAFEEIKAFKMPQLPADLKTVCSCTKKPCDPNSSYCHREFAAIRFLQNRPGKCSPNEGCHEIQFIVKEGSEVKQ